MRDRKVDFHPVDSHIYIESLEKVAGRLDLINLTILTTNIAPSSSWSYTRVYSQCLRQRAVSQCHGRGRENLPGGCPLTLGTSTQAQNFKVNSQPPDPLHHHLPTQMLTQHLSREPAGFRKLPVMSRMGRMRMPEKPSKKSSKEMSSSSESSCIIRPIRSR